MESTVSTTTADLEPTPPHAGEAHSHGPSDKFYFGIFVTLFLITALEVSTYFWESWFGSASHKPAVVLLLVLMSVKFVMIASYFMHLKFDSPLLGRIFYFGLGTAIVVYLIALTVMHIWFGSGTKLFNDPPARPTPTTVVATGGASGG